MHRFARTSRAAICAAASILAFAGSAAAQEPKAADQRTIRRPTVITRPGHYTLDRNLAGATAEGPTIVVRARDVTLDLAGLTLFGPGDLEGTGILVEDAANVRIHNGSLTGFGIGVQAVGARNVVIEDLQIHGRDLGGAPPAVEIGILLVESRGVVVQDNVITDTFLGIFVRGEASGGNRLSDNVITGGAHGELAICYNPVPEDPNGGPDGDLIEGNAISHFNRGLAFSAGSAGNVVRDNAFAVFGTAVAEATAGANRIGDNAITALTP